MGSPLPGTDSLTLRDPLDIIMRSGINRFLDEKIDASVKQRAQYWKRNLSSVNEYEKSVEPNRERLRKITGAVDEHATPVMKGVSSDKPAIVSDMPGYTISEVIWTALNPPADLSLKANVKQSDWSVLSGPSGVEGEGLLLSPKGKCHGYVIVLPDADQTPEQLAGLAPGVEQGSQLSRVLAENGFCVISPVLLNRDTVFSKGIKPNQRTHRDWIYTPAFELGRHPVGYEVQKVSAAVEWCKSNNPDNLKIAVAGYGEGGMIAMYAAAIDTCIDGALISGYFGPRDRLWQEPLYRNIWGLLHEFGDAEIATLIAPRRVIIEFSEGPRWKRNVENTGPGELKTPPFREVEREFKRIERLISPDFGSRFLISRDTLPVPAFGSPEAVACLAELFGVTSVSPVTENLPSDKRVLFDPVKRQERAVRQMENYTQILLRNSEYIRDELIFDKLSFRSQKAYEKSAGPLLQEFKYEHIGWIDEPLLQNMHPRSRKIYDEQKWVGYDVVIDVWPGVIAWGVLCLPKNIKPGKKTGRHMPAWSRRNAIFNN